MSILRPNKFKNLSKITELILNIGFSVSCVILLIITVSTHNLVMEDNSISCSESCVQPVSSGSVSCNSSKNLAKHPIFVVENRQLH